MSRPGLYWSPSSASASPPSRCSTRRRRSSARCALALFAGLGVLYAASSLRAEIIFARALAERSQSAVLLGTIRAAAIFPLEARIREANARLHASFGRVPPSVALIELRRALEAAPNSPQLLYLLGRQQLRAADPAGALETLGRMRRLAPDWPETARLHAMIEQETMR